MPRQRQTVAVLRASGSRHYSQEELEERERVEVKPPETDRVDAPKYLKGALREKFDRIAALLLTMNIFSELDADALARYLIAEANYLSATNKLTAALARGDAKDADKWSAMQDRFFKQCRASGADLGLTVTGRCRLQLPNVPEDVDAEESELFGDG